MGVPCHHARTYTRGLHFRQDMCILIIVFCLPYRDVKIREISADKGEPRMLHLKTANALRLVVVIK